MIDISDVEPIKGKIIIEYDGSGVDAAKKDLESLADIVGGGLTESTGSANEALSSLDDQMGKSAESTASLTASVGALEKPLVHGSDAVVSMTDALGEHQSAVEETGKAYENLQRPIEGATWQMQYAVPPMVEIAENARYMQEDLGTVSGGFAQMGDTLTQAVPLLPQFATGMRSVSEEFDSKEFGLDTFNENMGVFQDALANPYPFSMIHQYLSETGQTWDDFSSSIGDNNAAMLSQIAAMPVVSEKAFGSMSSGVQGVGQTFVEAAGETEAFTQQWNDMGESIAGINKGGGVGTALYGPEESWSKLDGALASTEEGIGKIGTVAGDVTGGFSIGDMFGSLHQIAMPLMAVQMIGMAVGTVSQGIYNMAALAEGPAAHSVGSFTGAIDVLGKHVQSTAEQFSEGFGQGIKPMIDAMNNVNPNNDAWNSLGNIVGQAGSTIGNVLKIVAGGVVDLGSLGFTLNPSNPIGNSWLQSGWEGLANQFMGWIGQPEPYPSPAGSSSVQIDLPSIQASIAQSISVMNAQATNPQYLAANAYLQSQANYAQIGQSAYDTSHSTGMSPFDYAPQAYQNAMGSYALANGGSGFGLSNVDLNRLYFTSMLNNLPPYLLPQHFESGCFPAGTRVMLSDGTEKAIEALRIGEQVLAHDGIKQVAATILARILPPPKQVHELTFSDGGTLTLTDSHPISTAQGWKSISPDATKRENPDLVVTPLQVGDSIHTKSGTCTLLAIEPRAIVQVHNITVDSPHTFYAGGVLVHNKALGTQVMQNVANSEVPQMDMKNSNLIQSMMSNFSGVDLSHTFTASVTWVGQGLTNTFTGAASWVGQGLTNTFNGVASWIGQNLTNTFQGLASWVGQGLTNTFTGVANWVGQNLDHTFTGVANWTMQQVTQVVGSISGFAAGVEGFAGGLAVVGENGPELVYLPQGTSVYPQSTGGNFQPLNMSNESGPLIVTINHTTMLDGKVVAQETIPYIAPILRSVRGVRQ